MQTLEMKKERREFSELGFVAFSSLGMKQVWGIMPIHLP